MAQFASDSFTGTSGTTLQTYSANWVEHTLGGGGDMLITANRLQQRVTGEGLYYHTTSPSSADYSVSADLYTMSLSPAFNYTAIIGRVNTAALTYYSVRYGTSIGWQLTKIVAGTGTILGSNTLPAPGVGGSINVKLDMSGSVIKMLLNGSVLLEATDTSITSAGKTGLRVFNNNVPTSSEGLHFDNFSADEVSGGGGTSYLVSPSGSISFSGSSTSIRGKVFNGSGSITFSGTSSLIGTRNFTITPNGGVVITGTAPMGSTAISNYTISPSGGVTFMGNVLLIKTHIQLPSGQINFSGSAPLDSNTVIIIISTRLPLTGSGK